MKWCNGTKMDIFVEKKKGTRITPEDMKQLRDFIKFIKKKGKRKIGKNKKPLA